MDWVRIRHWVRSKQVQPQWLWLLGSAFVLISALLGFDSFSHAAWARFTSRSYHWIFYYIPIRGWVFVMLGAGLTMLFAAHRWDRGGPFGWVQPIAVGLSVFVSTMWALGLILAAFTGYATGNTGAVVWSLLAIWSVQVTRHGG